MRVAILVGLLFIVPIAPASAQEQRGSIEGVGKDASGGALPGVVIEARRQAMVGVQTTTSDGVGAYRFPALPPGKYVLTATLSGFNTTKLQDLALELGQVLKADFTRGVGGLSETVQVSGEPPLIDVKQNAAATSITAEVIDRVPK